MVVKRIKEYFVTSIDVILYIFYNKTRINKYLDAYTPTSFLVNCALKHCCAIGEPMCVWVLVYALPNRGYLYRFNFK